MQSYMAMKHHELAEHLHSARQKIYVDWFEKLQDRFGAKAEIKMALIRDNREAGVDLFALLINSLQRPLPASELTINSLNHKIRSLDFSISDYFEESTCLEECLDASLRSTTCMSDRQILDATTTVHHQLGAITARILSECSQIYEHIAETSKTAFCQTDRQGHILCANREMERLAEEKSLIGKSLDAYFAHEDRAVVRDAILNRDTGSHGIVRLTMMSAKGKRTSVGAEVGSLLVEGQYKGGYAHITDISLSDAQHNQLYDRAQLGIVKLNRKGDILFANKSMLQMINREDFHGISVFDILPDDRTRELVRAQLDARFGWKSDEYPLELLRDGYPDPVRVPVMVSAFPETDLSGKKIIGSFAIIRSMLAKRMHHHIESRHDETDLLQAVIKELELVVPFDMAVVTKYSYDLKSACAIFSSNVDESTQFRRRWWKLTPAQIKWATEKDILLVEDLEKFLEQPDWVALKQEPDIQDLLIKGYKSFIFYPIFRDQGLVASVSLMSKSHNTLKEHHKNQLLNLPIKAAVHMALYYLTRRESAFTSDLILNLTNACTNMDAIANILVESISVYFHRQSVSLFKVNPKDGNIWLLDQAFADEKYAIDKDYHQTTTEGVLGYVSRHGTVENIGNVRKDERFNDIYHSAVSEVQMSSELCIPIRFGGAMWLLNIEDEQIDAFSEEEQKELCRVMARVENYLERTWLSRFLEASLKSSSDAVLVTDDSSRVIQVNSAANDLLAVDPLEIRSGNDAADQSSRALVRIAPKHLRDLLVNPEEADWTIDPDCQPPAVIKLKKRTSGAIPVHLTRVDLQEDFGHTIYIASDLTAQQRLKEIENLEKIYHEIAIQTKTPLSLAQGWLNRLKSHSAQANLKDIVDKSLRQLKKLGVTYDRLALYAADKEALPFNRTLIDIVEVVDAVKEELPAAEQSQIAWGSRNGEVLIQGDLFQLRFCLETILTYLLRFVPEDDQISLSVTADNENCVVEIIGWMPGRQPGLKDPAGDKNQVAQAVADMAFGRRLVDNIIIRHGGTFAVADQGSDIAVFRLTLPLCKGDRHETQGADGHTGHGHA